MKSFGVVMVGQRFLSRLSVLELLTMLLHGHCTSGRQKEGKLDG